VLKTITDRGDVGQLPLAKNRSFPASSRPAVSARTVDAPMGQG